jgi:DNA-binding MltR family transcriptional regulator
MVQKAKASELFDAFAEDLLAERSARPLIIVAASKVDDLLGEMLRVFLLPKIAKAKDQDELLEGDTPLATFSARINLCRRLGLIDETLYFALDRLRRLRNLSAHSIAFDDAKSPVREHLAELKKQIASRQSYRLIKERYFNSATLQAIEEWQCLLLTLCALLEAIREKVGPTSGNKSALSIAAR